MRRIVVKVGTAVMTNKDNRILRPVLRNIVRQIYDLYEQDIMTVLVSSGSVIAGKEVLSNSKHDDIATRRQVYSAIGQPRMMRLYYNIFRDYGMLCAQVLPTKRDFTPGSYRDNIINCYEGLMEDGVIPIANEDDAVSLSHTMFTDNDELASLIAELIKADTLILLTDEDGVFNGHPKKEESSLIKEVQMGDNVEKFIVSSGKGEAEGRGGMKSKISIAKNAAANGIVTYIANGKTDNVIRNIINGESVGTKFH